MEFTLELAGILVLVAVAAGFIDSIAGGGGLLVIPALLLTGMSPAQALGTNKLQAVFGKGSSVYYFWRQGIYDWHSLKPALLICSISAFLGAFAIQILEPSLLKQVIPWVIIAIAIYTLFSPKISDDEAKRRIPWTVFLLVPLPLIIFYDGFFGPASGSFLLIAFMLLNGDSVVNASAKMRLFLLISNIAALVAFSLGGNVLWQVGFAMALGQWLGARLGSTLVHRKGAAIVKPMLAIVSFSIAGRLFLK